LLQGVVVVAGIGALAFLLWEPHVEGRNAHATVFEIYFKDPFLAYAYAGSIAFFIALARAFTLLGSIGRGEWLSAHSLRALRTIKSCAIVLVAMIGAALAYLVIAVRGKDDIAGGMAIGLFLILTFALAGLVAARERRAPRGRGKRGDRLTARRTTPARRIPHALKFVGLSASTRNRTAAG
jgi:hypothetical protein